MENTRRQAFVVPHAAPRRARSASLPFTCHNRHCLLRRPRTFFCLASRRSSSISAVQTSPVSGDNDGEVHDEPVPQKSYSVGVTIVSGYDPQLRRSVIERIVAESDAGRVVVVTTGGMTSTDEPDGFVDSSEIINRNPNQLVDDISNNSNDKKPINGFADPENNSHNETEDETGKSIVSNLEGWISCSSPEEMAEVVVKLAASRECDYIVAEGSVNNSMEPQELAQLLHSRGGASLRVDTLVSVLDANTLLQDLSISPTLQTEETTKDEDTTTQAVDQDNLTPESIRDATDTRPMVVVSLLENANVIVVKQSDDEEAVEQTALIDDLVSLLNGTANVLRATDDGVPVNQLVNTNSYDRDNVRLSATWKKVLLASRASPSGVAKPNLPKTLKDVTFVYRARRPFHPQRLYEHIRAVATFKGVIRSTGRIWLATRMLAPLEWNQAGVAATLRVGKLFWAAVPETEWPSDEDEREQIMQDWDNQYGDRETEIVFLGMGIDKPRLQGLLDGCLLQDEEMVFTKMWENFEDPFVEWVPLLEEDEESLSINDSNQPSNGVSPPLDNMEKEAGEEDSDGESITQSELRKEAATLSDDRQEEMQVAQQVDENLSNSGEVEGMLNDFEIPDDVVEQVSALNILQQGFESDKESLVMQPEDDGVYDADDVVIASWEGEDADEILTKIPRVGLPVTIVTGFLGSGKTTLLNYILTTDHGFKIAVLVNEFGDIDIDNQLVEKGYWNSDDEVLELANGCICCTINDSFVNAVKKVLERENGADYLIVETTGVADPVPVINSLMVSDIADEVRVDGILTLVDSENFNTEAQKNSEAAISQIIASDTILLSKTDIASPEQIQATIDYVKSLRPAARILKSQRGRVPINMILDVGLRVSDSPAHLNPIKKAETHSHEHHDHEHSHDHDHEHSHDHDHEHNHEHDHECGPDCTDESHQHEQKSVGHLEADGFVTTSFKSDKALDPELFMNNFLQQLPEGVYRAKGLLWFYGYGKRYVFQLSGRRYQFEEDDWPEGVAPGNQLVLIGKDLDLEELRKTLEACQVR